MSYCKYMLKFRKVEYNFIVNSFRILSPFESMFTIRSGVKQLQRDRSFLDLLLTQFFIDLEEFLILMLQFVLICNDHP